MAPSGRPFGPAPVSVLTGDHGWPRLAAMARPVPARRILVKCPNWVGDLVIATGALRRIRALYPDARIHLLAKPSFEPILADAPWHDDFIGYDRHGAGFGERRRVLRRLREEGYDLAVLLAHGLSARLLLWQAGIPRRLGISRNAFGLFLSDRVPLNRLRSGRPYVSKVEVYRAVCEKLGCPDAEDQRPELHFSREQESRAAALLAAAGASPERPLIGLVPGASYGPSKRWPADRFAGAADRLIAEQGCDAVLFTGPGEEDVADAVMKAARRKLIRFAPGESDLGLLKALVGRCALLICNDTGPRHYAIALGVPTVTLMGSTDPRVTETPYERGTLLRQEVPCGPCYRRRCNRDHECMTAITVEQVVTAAERWLTDGGRPPTALGRRV